VEWSLQIENESSSDKTPCPRMQHASTIVKSSSILKMYIFGGKSKYRLLNDLWCLDVESMMWKQIKYEGVNPSPRQGHILVSYASFLLLFGGYSPDFKNPSSCFPSDIFIIDTEGTLEWEVFHFEDGPKGRSLSSAVIYDEDNLIIFGGMTLEKNSLTKISDMWRLKTYLSKVKETKISKYQVLNILDQGTQGKHYKVEFNKEYFYLKVSNGSKIDSNYKPNYVQSNVKHRNILEITEVLLDISQGLQYEIVVYPYCDLGDLTTYYRNFKTFVESVSFIFFTFKGYCWFLYSIFRRGELSSFK
jgi:hypothetical protein